MDPTIVFEIDRILELNEKEALVSFMGGEVNARWIPREELASQGLNDLIADFLDSSQATLESATSSTGPKFTMSQTAVARLENKRTHDAFARKYHRGQWLDNCPKCGEEGVKGNALLMCDFCPNAFHFGCVGMDLRERAPKGDWQCPPCRTADDLTRLDEKPRKQARLTGPHRKGRAARPVAANITITPATTPAEVTEQLRHPAVLPAETSTSLVTEGVVARKRGRPRRDAAISAATTEAAPAQVLQHSDWTTGTATKRRAALVPPRSTTTRQGTAAHGVPLTPALPMEERMLMVHEQEEPEEQMTSSHRRVLLTTTATKKRKWKRGKEHGQRIKRPRNSDQDENRGTEDALRRC
jgi:hypothetical protein